MSLHTEIKSLHTEIKSLHREEWLLISDQIVLVLSRLIYCSEKIGVANLIIYYLHKTCSNNWF